MLKTTRLKVLLTTTLAALTFCSMALANNQTTAIIYGNDIERVESAGIGRLDDFPTRTAIVLPTLSTNKDVIVFGAITDRIREVFRYPYYELLSSNLVTNGNSPIGEPSVELLKKNSVYIQQPPTQDYLAKVAAYTNADIVIKPVLNQWEYYDIHRSIPYGLSRHTDDYGETYTYINTKISLCSYNRLTGEYRIDTATYQKTLEKLSAPNEREVLDILMSRVLEKLPYKRIPTDIPRYNANKNNGDTINNAGNNQGTGVTPNGLPTLSRNVDSPYNLPRNIQQF